MLFRLCLTHHPRPKTEGTTVDASDCSVRYCTCVTMCTEAHVIPFAAAAFRARLLQQNGCPAASQRNTHRHNDVEICTAAARKKQ